MISLTGAGSRDSRLLPIWDQGPEYGTRGISHCPPPKRAGACALRAPPQQAGRR